MDQSRYMVCLLWCNVFHYEHIAFSIPSMCNFSRKLKLLVLELQPVSKIAEDIEEELTLFISFSPIESATE